MPQAEFSREDEKSPFLLMARMVPVICQDPLYRFGLFILFYFLSKLRSPSIQVCSDQREGCGISLIFFHSSLTGVSTILEECYKASDSWLVIDSMLPVNLLSLKNCCYSAFCSCWKQFREWDKWSWNIKYLKGSGGDWSHRFLLLHMDNL